jgi:hypothetical protein
MIAATRFVWMIFLLVTVPREVMACIFQEWTYEQLRNEADVIVVAEPIATANIGNLVPTGRKYMNADGSQADLLGLAIRTRFNVLAVLKGKVSDEFALTIFKDVPYKTREGLLFPSTCPFAYREFDPAKHERYLIFLEAASGKGFDLVGGQGVLMPGISKLEGAP